jgi:hypothetical protein
MKMNDRFDVVKSYIKALPDVAVYWVVGRDSVYINTTTRLKEKLGVVCSLPESVSGGVLEYLEVPAHPVYKLIIAEQVRQKLLGQGSQYINQLTPFIKFNVLVRTDPLSRNVLVLVMTAKREIQVVGVFSTLYKAEEYADWLRGMEGGVQPVFALNEATGKYCRADIYKHSYLGRKSPTIESNEVTQI